MPASIIKTKAIIQRVSLTLFFCVFATTAFAADTTAPTGSIKINNNATSTTTINVTLNLSATDSGSGVAQMQFSNNGSTWSTPEAYSTTKTWVLSYGSGTRKVYVKYKDNAGNWSRSYYDSISLLKQTPQLGTITPSSGTSSPDQTVNFTTTYSDNNGWQDIKIAYFLVNISTSGANCAYLYYDQNNNKLYLRNNANSAWLGGYALGSSYVIENSYAKLDCSKTTILGDNINLTINWNLTFKPTFTGAKKTYLYVKDDANAYANWTQKGTWTISQGATPPEITSITPVSGSTFYEIDAVTASAVVNGTAPLEYQFSVDGVVKQAWSSTANYTWSATRGLHTIKIEVRNTAGQDTEEAGIFVFRKPILPP